LEDLKVQETPTEIRGFIPSEQIDGFAREDECKWLSGLSRSTRWRLERAGKFPRRESLSSNAVGWRRAAIRQWLQGKRNGW
jgi:prophage regulatory protein